MEISELKTDALYLEQSGMLCYTPTMGMPTGFELSRFGYPPNFPIPEPISTANSSVRIDGSPPPSINDSFSSGFSHDSSPDTVQLNHYVSPEISAFDQIEPSWAREYSSPKIEPDYGPSSHPDSTVAQLVVCALFATILQVVSTMVPSCEACKAFFKRTVQGAIDYTCPSNNDCPITKRRRKACQACRFQKCIRVGMLREGVRLDRVRGGRQKYRRTVGDAAACTTSTVSQRPMELQQIVAQLLQAERKVAPTFKPLQLDVTGGCVNRFASGVRDRLLNLISWAKNVPGFCEMALPTQTTVLRNGWLDALALDFAFYSQPSSSQFSNQYRIVVSKDFIFSKETCKTLGIEKFHEVMKKLLLSLSAVKLSSSEFVLLKALFLFGTLEPIDSKAKMLANKVTRLFSEYCNSGASDDDNRLGSLMVLSSYVRELALNVKDLLLMAPSVDPLVNELLRGTNENLEA
ncbi:Oidioi.mRNA.OKI2018_I69.PAR.g9833.t1.cds [Oikopleura dioica]|uniref:Oidioi.mRNA.OKI2018_I69.PAR.g9833.t1.cds n=1 Tax=Oikopleura dioica TaxID=34765 RepID=A0ABN7RMM5_OIKDI|nr:Oidioi.mRNA.OKI2018_I69.PAR.g9833.t1.cds [Oikopleura dioica]